jgi:hypothetical protein
MPEVAQRFGSFREFYPYYLGEHSDRTCRRLHVVGTTLAVVQAVAALLLRAPALLFSGLVAAYGFAWVGHFVFEKNRPATFRYPLYSLLGDFAMVRDVLAGRIRW